jgi:hypothetical protein
VDVNRETHVALAARIRIVMSTVNANVNRRKDTKKCCAKCDSFSGQMENLNSHHFKKWGLCWPHGLNKLEPVIQKIGSHCLQTHFYHLDTEDFTDCHGGTSPPPFF